MPDSLFPDSELPTTPKLGSQSIWERISSALPKQDRAANVQEYYRIAHEVLSSLPSAGLEISDRGRVADFKACLSDWLRLAADNAAGGEESVDFEELRARTRRLIGGSHA